MNSILRFGKRIQQQLLMIAQDTGKFVLANITDNFGTLGAPINEVPHALHLIGTRGGNLIEQMSQAHIMAMNIADKNTSRHSRREATDDWQSERRHGENTLLEVIRLH